MRLRRADIGTLGVSMGGMKGSGSEGLELKEEDFDFDVRGEGRAVVSACGS